MQAKWKKNKNLKPKVILEKIDSLANIENDIMSYSNFEFLDAKTALESMIDFPAVAIDLDKNKIISSAIWEIIKNKPSDPKKYIELVSINIKEALAKRNEQYYLLTSISILNIGIRFIKLNDCIIRFYKSDFPRKFKGREALIKNKKTNVKVESTLYTKVVIEIMAKSEEIAAGKALRVLDLFRSLMNLFANYQSEYIGNQWDPINKVRLGEFHTVHNYTGQVYSKMFWFDSTYSKTRPYISNEIALIINNVKFVMSNLNKFHSKYKSILTEGLLKYVRSFDEKKSKCCCYERMGGSRNYSSSK